MSGIISNIYAKPEATIAGVLGSYMVPAGKFAQVSFGGSIVGATFTNTSGVFQNAVLRSQTIAPTSGNLSGFCLNEGQVLSVGTFSNVLSGSVTSNEQFFTLTPFVRLRVDGVTGSTLSLGVATISADSAGSGSGSFTYSIGIEVSYIINEYSA